MHTQAACDMELDLAIEFHGTPAKKILLEHLACCCCCCCCADGGGDD